MFYIATFLKIFSNIDHKLAVENTKIISWFEGKSGKIHACAVETRVTKWFAIITLSFCYALTAGYQRMATWCGGNAFRENFRAEERVADVLRSKASSLTTPRRVVFELLHEPYAKARRCKRDAAVQRAKFNQVYNNTNHLVFLENVEYWDLTALLI